MSDIERLFDTLAQAKRPCPCEPCGCGNIADGSWDGAHQCPVCQGCHGSGTVLVFAKSMWRECVGAQMAREQPEDGYVCCPRCYETMRGLLPPVWVHSPDCTSCNGSGLVRREYREPLEAVGPVLADYCAAVVNDPDVKHQERAVVALVHSMHVGQADVLTTWLERLLADAAEFGWLPTPEVTP